MLGYRCGSLVFVCACIFVCVWESSFCRTVDQTLPLVVSSWLTFKELVTSSPPSPCHHHHHPFLSKCSSGSQEALAHKASIQGCHLTDSKMVAGRWTAVCRWTWKKQKSWADSIRILQEEGFKSQNPSRLSNHEKL